MIFAALLRSYTCGAVLVHVEFEKQVLPSSSSTRHGLLLSSEPKMGNETVRQLRHGQGRRGPAQRQREEEESFEAIQLARSKTAARVRKHRDKRKRMAESVQEGGDNSDAFEEGFCTSTLHSHVKKLVSSVEPVLVRCPSLRSRQLVLQKFLGHPSIKPSLPSFYLPRKEAVAQQLLIEGLRSDLEGVKGVQSREMLAWKGTLLSAAVRKSAGDSSEGQGRALARVLNTNPMNIYSAMKRRQLSVDASASQWAPLAKKNGQIE